MKELVAGVVIIFVLGIGAFLYRNTVERPGVIAPEIACTLEAKICPDGSSVGRTGPSCQFAPCPFPNVEVGDMKIAFVVPAGYTLEENAPGSGVILRKPSGEIWPEHTITIRRYSIPEGETADTVILEHTEYQPSGEVATDFSKFRDVEEGRHVFKGTTIERFEGVVRSAYHLSRTNDVLVFEVLETGVQNWTDPTLIVQTLPEHQALLGLLRRLETVE